MIQAQQARKAAPTKVPTTLPTMTSAVAPGTPRNMRTPMMAATDATDHTMTSLLFSQIVSPVREYPSPSRPPRGTTVRWMTNDFSSTCSTCLVDMWANLARSLRRSASSRLKLCGPRSALISLSCVTVALG